MQTYLALLRGINVGGQKIIKMENLRALMIKIGFEKVQTYIQSGNIIFDAVITSKSELVHKIGQAIEENYGFDVGIIILDYNDLEVAIKNNSFIKMDADAKHLYVTFLSENPLPENIAKWESEKFFPDLAIINRTVVYLKYYVSAGNSKLTNVLIEKQLNVVATSRNWNTTLKLKQVLEERREF